MRSSACDSAGLCLSEGWNKGFIIHIFLMEKKTEDGNIGSYDFGFWSFVWSWVGGVPAVVPLGLEWVTFLLTILVTFQILKMHV